jgi:putative transposase
MMTFEDRRHFTVAAKPKKRPGSKPSAFANVRHRPRAVHKYWNPLHVTMRGRRGLPSFRAETLYAAFERAVRRTRREDFRVVEFSVQDDHLHLIVEADDSDALARGMKSFSVRANRIFNAALGRGPRPRLGRPLSPSRSHERAPGSKRDRVLPPKLQEAPARDERDAAHRPVLVGSMVSRMDRAIRQHDDGERQRPTEEARTVLLRRAWQKHGFIHPGERPRAPS